MSGKLRRCLAGLVVLAIPVTAVAAAPDATTEFVYDLWHTNEFARTARILRSDNARMELELRDTQDRMAIKEQVVAELIAGRMSLDVAVDRFVQLNRDRPVTLIFLAGGTDEEIAACSILTYVSTRAAGAVPPLAAEYEARFGRPFPGKMMRD